MKRIDVNKIMKDFKMTRKALSFILYPAHRQPLAALRRLENYETELSEEQVARLAHYLEMSIDKLYSGLDWDLDIMENKIKFMSYTGGFEAFLNTDTWITKVYSAGSLVYESVIHSEAIRLSDYVKELNKIVKNSKGNEYFKSKFRD